MENKNLQRELDIGEILSQTFHLYSRNFVQYLIPFLAAGILTGLVTMVITPPESPVHATSQQLLAWFPSYMIAIAISGIVSWIANSITTGITVKLTSDMLERGQANLQTAFNFTLPRLLSLLAASIITGILIVLGFIALIVPGIILALMFSLVYPAIMLEGKGALGSLYRSRELVSKRWVNTFVLLLLLGIIVVIVSLVFSLVAAPFGVFSPLVSALLTAFISPIFVIAITLYYYSMKARTLPLPPPPPPAQTI